VVVLSFDFKNSKIGRIASFVHECNMEILSDVKIFVVKKIPNLCRGCYNYVRKHPIRVVVEVVGLVLFGVFSYCDVLFLINVQPPPNVPVPYTGFDEVWRIITTNEKPPGLSICPPHEPYHFSQPVGMEYAPLSIFDWLSLLYPPAYLIFQGCRLGYRLYRGRKRKIKRRT